MRALLLALGLLLATPTAAQTTRALIVGIDTYQYSTTTTRGAQFTDLRGAVADAVTFKNLLRTVYRIDLDRTAQGQCPTAPHPLSTTLYNHCATRAAILAALDDLVARSAPGDTLVFYFSGHGSLYVDRRFDQASGYNGTILSYDARRPGAESEGEIFDIELKAKKTAAVAKGIYWVTVFDSCNSGTATRDGALGQARSAPP
ncbi:MAG: caspase family protein, partial [Novosphingobium sp.]